MYIEIPWNLLKHTSILQILYQAWCAMHVKSESQTMLWSPVTTPITAARRRTEDCRLPRITPTQSRAFVRTDMIHVYRIPPAAVSVVSHTCSWSSLVLTSVVLTLFPWQIDKLADTKYTEDKLNILRTFIEDWYSEVFLIWKYFWKK